MDLEHDTTFFWIAREGLKAPLPAAWKPCQTDTHEVYYYNFQTKESIWEHPCDEYYRKMLQRERDKANDPASNRSLDDKEPNDSEAEEVDEHDSGPHQLESQKSESPLTSPGIKSKSILGPITRQDLPPIGQGKLPSIQSSLPPLSNGMKAPPIPDTTDPSRSRIGSAGNISRQSSFLEEGRVSVPRTRSASNASIVSESHGSGNNVAAAVSASAAPLCKSVSGKSLAASVASASSSPRVSGLSLPLLRQTAVSQHQLESLELERDQARHDLEDAHSHIAELEESLIELRDKLRNHEQVLVDRSARAETELSVALASAKREQVDAVAQLRHDLESRHADAIERLRQDLAEEHAAELEHTRATVLQQSEQAASLARDAVTEQLRQEHAIALELVNNEHHVALAAIQSQLAVALEANSHPPTPSQTDLSATVARAVQEAVVRERLVHQQELQRAINHSHGADDQQAQQQQHARDIESAIESAQQASAAELAFLRQALEAEVARGVALEQTAERLRLEATSHRQLQDFTATLERQVADLQKQLASARVSSLSSSSSAIQPKATSSAAAAGTQTEGNASLATPPDSDHAKESQGHHHQHQHHSSHRHHRQSAESLGTLDESVSEITRSSDLEGPSRTRSPSASSSIMSTRHHDSKSHSRAARAASRQHRRPISSPSMMNRPPLLKSRVAEQLARPESLANLVPGDVDSELIVAETNLHALLGKIQARHALRLQTPEFDSMVRPYHAPPPPQSVRVHPPRIFSSAIPMSNLELDVVERQCTATEQKLREHAAWLRTFIDGLAPTAAI
ncbi:hypothetical protein BC828DRAFT_388991 [Blastocladiella britannica]|nr:hypothetical protein BC828DRAFT_388991 [Blastocladiella britannica]